MIETIVLKQTLVMALIYVAIGLVLKERMLKKFNTPGNFFTVSTIIIFWPLLLAAYLILYRG